TSTCASGSGWHIGIRFDVCLAAMMPATRATSSGSPLGFFGSALSTAGFIATNGLASASRGVTDLSLTSPMRALPARTQLESLRGMKKYPTGREFQSLKKEHRLLGG